MRRLLLLLGLAVLVACSGPDDHRKPPPLYTIEVQSRFEYLLDGQPMTRRQLERRLQEIADEHRRPVVHNARVHLHLYGNGAGTGGEVQRLASFCMQIGLDKIRIGR
jgi:biopolymer transport protein ExbD